MTKRAFLVHKAGGRRRPPYHPIVGAMVALWLVLGAPATTFAHAEPERSNPSMNGVVPVAPTTVEIWFSEEAKTEGTSIQVIGPDGVQVDLGDSKVDLQDPNREHAIVSLRPGLGSGTYTVAWTSVSGTDGDEAQGQFTFTVESGSPVASPVASPMASPVAATTSIGTGATSGTVEEGNFDSQAFGISAGVGLVFAGLIYLFWRLVRPKDPKFRA